MSKNITKEIIQEFNNRQESGLKEIFYLMLRELHVYSARISGDWQESEDIVLNSFIKLWQSTAKFKAGVALSAYMYKLVRNETLNYIRSDKCKYRKISDEESAGIEVEEKQEHDIYAEKIKRINAFIETLPCRCKQVMHLHLLCYNSKEISEVLCMSVSTVDNQKYIAMQKLKKHFENGN